jgi:membrane-associated phospholipid phosphatase
MKENNLQDPNAQNSFVAGLRSPGLLARRPVIGWLMFIFGVLGFGCLTYNLFAQGPLLELDRRIAIVWPAIALKGPAYIKGLIDSGFYIGDQVIIGLCILLGIYFIFRRYWEELTMIVIGIPGSSALFLLLSRAIGRVRPSTQIWIVEKIPGFPSGHAITAFTFFFLMAYLLVPKMRTAFSKGVVVFLATFIIVFVGFSRVFTGGHYLTDVLAGYAVGIAWSGLAYTLIEGYFKKRESQNVKKE